jgi:hypothetical protein
VPSPQYCCCPHNVAALIMLLPPQCCCPHNVAAALIMLLPHNVAAALTMLPADGRDWLIGSINQFRLIALRRRQNLLLIKTLYKIPAATFFMFPTFLCRDEQDFLNLQHSSASTSNWPHIPPILCILLDYKRHYLPLIRPLKK